MPLRVLIVPDKFKGTLSADASARAMAAGWSRARPGDRLELIPMSDGGDGFGPVLGGLLNARSRRVVTVDAAGQPRSARWWWSASTRTAVIETAESNGLALLPKGRFHPFTLDTWGVGRMIQAALRAGASSCLLGIGGSATNDGGFGVARALGWRFLDRHGNALTRWIDLERLEHLEPPALPRGRCRFVVATDVSNPLLGPRGASRIYGPQKGLRPQDMRLAEGCLRRLATVVRRDLGFDQRQPGCGAAGGLGFGLQAFFGAARRLGFDLFAETAKLASRIQRADLILTGEGSVDRSTAMGKGVGQLLQLCARHGRPVILLGGRVTLRGRLPQGVVQTASLIELVGEQAAMAEPARHLRTLAGNAARRFTPG